MHHQAEANMKLPLRFRLVSMQVTELRDCRTLSDLKNQLDSFPKDLFGFYDRIISTIKDRDRIHAHKILQWLAFSARPLELKEIAQVVAIVQDPHQGIVFDADNLPRDPRDIFRICTSFITQEEGDTQTNLQFPLADGRHRYRQACSHICQGLFSVPPLSTRLQCQRRNIKCFHFSGMSSLPHAVRDLFHAN
jgi:hypothetical protein